MAGVQQKNFEEKSGREAPIAERFGYVGDTS